MSLDGRPFIVLTLDPENGRFAGTRTHPLRMTTDGLSVSGISCEVTTEPLTTDVPREGALRPVATAPDDPADTTVFEFHVTAPGEGQLKPAGAPFPAWPIRRQTGSGIPQVWTGWDANRSYAVQEPYVAPNAAMVEIHSADQAVRQSYESFKANAKQIEREDAARREEVRSLLARGELRAAQDFRLAAMVFQHGREPRDYLFAHTLALVALAKGDRSASWIAAASVDRYLDSLARPQVFGTKFSPDDLTQEPFDRELVPDALRRELGVPVLAEQQAEFQTLLQK